MILFGVWAAPDDKRSHPVYIILFLHDYVDAGKLWQIPEVASHKSCQRFWVRRTVCRADVGGAQWRCFLNYGMGLTPWYGTRRLLNWNRLLREVVESPSLEVLKKRVDATLSDVV